MVADRHHGYILRGNITGLYKVGITGNLSNRMSAYRTHTPERIMQETVKNFLSMDEARDWERIILNRHSDSIEHGEWLRLNFEEMAEACSVGSDLVGPDAVGPEMMIQAQLPDIDGKMLVRVFRCDNDKCCTVCDVVDYINSLSNLHQPEKKTFLFNAPRFISREYLISRLAEQAVEKGLV